MTNLLHIFFFFFFNCWLKIFKHRDQIAMIENSNLMVLIQLIYNYMHKGRKLWDWLIFEWIIIEIILFIAHVTFSHLI